MKSKPLTVAMGVDGAMEVLQDLTKNPGKNSTSLLKEPASASDPTWHLWLPAHFNSALDLRFLQKQKTKNKTVVATWKEWVQGGRFHFNEGSLLYDRDVSALDTWGDKLAAIDFYILIHAAKPVTVKTVKEQASGERGLRRHPGMVSFAIHAASSSGSAQAPEELTMTQDDFVRFAITGQR
ncbi:MAG: hypothetical protein RLZZ117_363 [Cyanobacteriota bacterium]|jgi:hypothetical protein